MLDFSSLSLGTEVLVGLELHLDTGKVMQAHPDEPLVVSPDTTIDSIFNLLVEQQQACVLVCNDGNLMGIFTERDCLRLMATGAVLSRPISEEMASNVVYVSDSTTVQEAVMAMAQGGYRQVPIVDGGGCPVGVLKVAGVLHYLVEHFPQVIYTLPPEPKHNTQQREGA